MRARRFRPSFDALTLRITPSDLTPLTPPVAGPADSSNIGTGLDPWMVTGPPQNPPSNVLKPTQGDGIGE